MTGLFSAGSEVTQSGASEASAKKCNYKSCGENPTEILAPVAVEILFCASEASEKKIVTENGTSVGREKMLLLLLKRLSDFLLHENHIRHINKRQRHDSQEK